MSKRKKNKPVSIVQLWIGDHMYLIYILIAIILFLAVFFGIRYYNKVNHPMYKFISASAKDFNASFSFDCSAEKNGETVMHYTGSYEADPNQQDLKAVYEADYGSYTYTGAVFAEDDTRISGSLYDGEWRVRDCTDKVLNFFDFNTDYRQGRIDSASLLRFTDLTSRFSANELNDFMTLFINRMDGNSSLAKVETTHSDNAKAYAYTVDVGEFFDLVRDKGASIFFNALHYDAFCSLYELNKKTVDNAACSFTYTINDAGWLTDFSFSITAAGDEYTIRCAMDDLGSAEAAIPDAFFDAEVAE